MSCLSEVLDRIVAQNPMQAAFFARVVPTITDAERNDLERYISHCEADGIGADELASAYDGIVKDTVREQLYFRRHDCYRHSRYADVAADVYLNPAYMSRYMHGLALTAFLWPNHAAMRRWFVAHLPIHEAGARYLEIGPGHGFYFMAALRSGAFSQYDGVDISPTSVALTRSLVQRGAFGTFDHWSVEERDFFEDDRARGSSARPYDFVTMGEVLEHVEDPARFLAHARDLCGPGATLFVTTCINSPELDHIYLFRTVEEVHALVEGSGLVVRDRLVLAYGEMTLAESMRQKMPVNIALLLGRGGSEPTRPTLDGDP